VREGVSQELVDWLAYRGSADVRGILEPHISASARETDPSVLKAIREDDERKALWNRRIQEQKDVLISCPTLGLFLQAAVNLRKDSWPALEVSRKEWLQQQVDDELGRLDLLENIRWIDQNSFSIPVFLPVLMELIDQYALRLAHDEHLVDAVGAREAAILHRDAVLVEEPAVEGTHDLALRVRVDLPVSVGDDHRLEDIPASPNREGILGSPENSISYVNYVYLG